MVQWGHVHFFEVQNFVPTVLWSGVTSFCCTVINIKLTHLFVCVFHLSSNMKFLACCLGMVLGCEKQQDVFYAGPPSKWHHDYAFEGTVDACCNLCCGSAKKSKDYDAYAWYSKDIHSCSCIVRATSSTKPTSAQPGWTSGACSAMLENTTVV